MSYGASPGVSSPDGGGGRLISVGALAVIVIGRCELTWVFLKMVWKLGEQAQLLGK